jgi:hypothetical protein
MHPSQSRQYYSQGSINDQWNISIDTVITLLLGLAQVLLAVPPTIVAWRFLRDPNTTGSIIGRPKDTVLITLQPLPHVSKSQVEPRRIFEKSRDRETDMI